MTRYATTEFNRRDRLRDRVRDAFGTVRHLRLSDDVLAGLLAEIRGSEDWRRAPRPTIEYLTGYIHAMREEMWHGVRFFYVTERGPVAVRTGGNLPKGTLTLTDEECRNVGAKNYPRGFAWPAEDGQPLAWFTVPRREGEP